MKVSIITVVYNSQDTVADALRSVAEQDYPDIQHIVIDGGSNDNTVDVISANLDRVSVFISEPDRGIYDAMNKGIDQADGDIIGFLNSDDVYAHKSVVSTIVDAIVDNNVDGCYANLIYLDDIRSSNIKRRWKSRDHEPGLCFKGWMPAHPTFYIKKAKFDQIGKFNIELGNQADLEFCARAFEIHKIKTVYHEEVWVKMRTGGVSQSNLITMLKSNWRSYKALRALGSGANPVMFFIRKFGGKIPQFFNTR